MKGNVRTSDGQEGINTLNTNIARWFLTLLVLGLGGIPLLQAQSSCDPSTPTFPVDLSSNPDTTWVSTDTSRQGNCCGTTPPDVCVAFELTLHPDAQGIIFDIYSGAEPPGALFYQVECGTPTPVGEMLCLNGAGPHHITFCKPGANANQYSIRTIPEPAVGPDVAVQEGCRDSLYAYGYEDSTLSWTSVYPSGKGSYDSLLTCTSGCDTTVVAVQQGTPPPYVDYQVCGRPRGGCDTNEVCDTVRVYFVNTLQVAIMPEDPAVCAGDATTTITANGSGGTMPYSYQWSTGETTQSISVGAGTYTVELSDSTGCPPAHDTVTVREFIVPVQAYAGSDTLVCSQSLPVNLEGEVDAASGGTWSGGAGTFSPHPDSLQIQYSPTSQELEDGQVELYLATTGNGGCPADTDTVRVRFSSTPDLNLTTSDISCYGAADDSALASVSGGVSPYQYSWDGGAFQNDSLVIGSGAGSHSVTVRDAVGCDTTATFTIGEPSPLDVAVSEEVPVTCKGGTDGSAVVTANGGTSPYSYSWDTSPVQTDTQATGLSAGIYEVTVTDAHGCSASDSVIIEGPDRLITTITDSKNATCYGDSNGYAVGNATGGWGGYTYSWNTTPVQQGDSATGLPAGTYNITVTDSLGCQASASVTVGQPPPLVPDAEKTDVSCYGGTDGEATVSVSGGTSPYTYSWGTSPTQNTVTATQLPAGTYEITITDDLGCRARDTVTVEQPGPLEVETTAMPVSCYGGSDGSLEASVEGGTSPYQYSWNTSPPSSSSRLDPLPAGEYQLTVTDANGCQETITDSVTEPSPLTLSASVSDVTCHDGDDGAINVQATGGTSPYRFMWDSLPTTSNIAQGLPAGEYAVTAVDTNGCRDTLSLTISEPMPLIASVGPGDTICPGSSATLNVNSSGGNGGYSYTWEPGYMSTPEVTVSPSLSTGYTVTVTDSLGCETISDTTSVWVKNLFPDSLKAISSGDICSGEEVTLSGYYGGSRPGLSFSWEPGNEQGLDPFVRQPDSSEQYILTAVNGCGASIEDTVTVQVFYPPDITPVLSNAAGCPPLEVEFQDSSSTDDDLTYLWHFGDGEVSGSPRPTRIYDSSGTYEVGLEVTTDQGCKDSSVGFATVQVYPRPEAGFSMAPSTVSILQPEVSFSPEGSSGAVRYLWNLGDGEKDSVATLYHTYEDTGVYPVRLMVWSSRGCKDSIVKPLRVKPSVSIYVPNAFTPTGDGVNDTFFPKMTGMQRSTFEMQIFNRWGEVIFESEDPEEHWEGNSKGGTTVVKNDVYVYQIRVKDVLGEWHELRGHVTLVK